MPSNTVNEMMTDPKLVPDTKPVLVTFAIAGSLEFQSIVTHGPPPASRFVVDPTHILEAPLIDDTGCGFTCIEPVAVAAQAAPVVVTV